MTRDTRKTALRYGLCLIGITTMALGVALTTKASLGTTPISALPYVASLGFQPSIGTFTALFNILLVVGQIVAMRSRFPKFQYLQIPVSCMFALFIDMWMAFLPEFAGVSLAVKLAALAAGTIALALGVYMEVSAGVVMMAGEGAVKALSILTRKDFGVLKTCFDVTLVALGALLSFALFHELKGVGPGTIFSACLVGVCVKTFHSLRRRLA